MHLTVTQHHVELTEPDVFTRFHVVASQGLTRKQCDSVLRDRGVGEVTPDNYQVLVLTDAVRRLAARHVADGWGTKFEAMLDYADTKGWLSDDRSAVLVHVEGAGQSWG